MVARKSIVPPDAAFVPDTVATAPPGIDKPPLVPRPEIEPTTWSPPRARTPLSFATNATSRPIEHPSLKVSEAFPSSRVPEKSGKEAVAEMSFPPLNAIVPVPVTAPSIVYPPDSPPQTVSVLSPTSTHDAASTTSVPSFVPLAMTFRTEPPRSESCARSRLG